MRKAAVLLILSLAFTGWALAQNPPAQQTQSQPQAQTPAADQQNSPQAQPPVQTTAPDQLPPDQQNPQQAQPAQPMPQADQPAQTAPLGTRPDQNAGGGEIASGTQIKASLDDALSTKTAHEGQQFTATVVDPVRSADGNIAIPVGSKIVGQVTEAEEGKTLPQLRGKARLNMRFTEVQLVNGATMPLAATLVSVNSTTKGTKTSTNNEGEVTSGNSGTRIAKDVGIGAGIGTVAGLIFGSALKGLAIGAIAGGGYVLATGGKQVELPAQTGMVLKVDQNTSVPAGPSTSLPQSSQPPPLQPHH
jgi:hypothetical protein